MSKPMHARGLALALVSIVGVGVLSLAGCGGAQAVPRADAPADVRVTVGPLVFVSPIPTDAPQSRVDSDDIDGTPLHIETITASTPRIAIVAFSLLRDSPWTGSRVVRLNEMFDTVTERVRERLSDVEFPEPTLDERDGVITAETQATLRASDGTVVNVAFRAVMSIHRMGALLVVAQEPWAERIEQSIEVHPADEERFVQTGTGELIPTAEWHLAWPLSYACLMPTGLAEEGQPVDAWTVGNEAVRYRARVGSQSAIELRDAATAQGSTQIQTLIVRGIPAYRLSGHDSRGWVESLVWDSHQFVVEGVGSQTPEALDDANRFLESCTPL
jgi:hypothetical protein